MEQLKAPSSHCRSCFVPYLPPYLPRARVSKTNNLRDMALLVSMLLSEYLSQHIIQGGLSTLGATYSIYCGLHCGIPVEGPP